ncbi:MAG TPA: GWxTD domain-containing protein [Ignavibacteriaceae bacterium]|nr:GWxTD domain-containing protein [Ignavibacteriaceae bacterium]
MKKIILVLYFSMSIQIFCQPERYRQFNSEKRPFQKPIFTQILIFPDDSLSTIYFLYKVPYQNLVFLKNSTSYIAEIRVDIEITDSNSNFIKREIKDWKIQTPSFEQTNSMGLFAEGLISVKLPEGKYNINPIITDQNSKREFKIGKEFLDVNKSKNKNELLVVNSQKNKCEGKEYSSLTNFEGNIPFSSGDYDLIIPISDLNLNEISVSVISNNDTIANKTLTESFISSIGFEECSGNIVVTENSGNKTRNFILSGISTKLKEGPVSFVIKGNKEINFNSNVYWYNKPGSLANPELAIEVLGNLERESTVDSLLDLDEDDYYEGLVNYWKKMDPSPETEFNELMTQFYSRVDYAQINFSTLTGRKGIETDRGKVFIKFGKPDHVERDSNEKGKIVETWIYTKSQMKFVFVDKQGVGEFSLESS